MTVLARTPAKLPVDLAAQVQVVAGDALVAADVDQRSPEDLCTNSTRLILDVIPRLGTDRQVWCGGGSTWVDGDPTSFGAGFVRGFSKRFLGLRRRDKDHQLALLQQHTDLDWFGVRPLQMRKGEHTDTCRLGMDSFSGMSKISFADCADVMIGMLTDDT